MIRHRAPASHTQTTTENFDATLLDQDVNIEFQRTTTWCRENYGADADGNRGMLMIVVDDDIATEITVNELPVDFLRSDLREAALHAVNQYTETHEPQADDQPDEPDYDDIGD